MDYSAEQEMELEALEAILMDDLVEMKDQVPSGWSPPGKVYKVGLQPNLEEEVKADVPVKAEIVFAHTASYPDEPPLLRVRGLSGLADADVAVLQGQLEEEMQASLGMAMVYTLISIAQEWINEKAQDSGAGTLDPEVQLRKEQEAEEARRAELRAHGTPVTPEAFRAWQQAFEAEQGLQATSLGAASQVAGTMVARVTGKQFFKMQEARHVEVEEEPSGSDEEGWDAPAPDVQAGDEEPDFDEDDSSDDELLLDELAADHGL